MCERWVGDWTDCNIFTPSSSVFSSTSFSFCWLLNRGSWGPSLLWELVLTTASYLQLTQPVCGTGLYNCLSSTCFLWASLLHPIQTHPQSRLYPDILDRKHLLFTQVHLLFDSSTEGQHVTNSNTPTASLQRRKTPPSWVFWIYDVPPVTLELWGMRSTPSLPRLPGPLWSEVVVLDRVLFLRQIELSDI